MPMVLSYGRYDWYQQWEGDIAVGLQDREEVIILEETHSSISNLFNNEPK